MREAEPLCAENIGLKDIARSRREELISRWELIMYYSSSTLGPYLRPSTLSLRPPSRRPSALEILHV